MYINQAINTFRTSYTFRNITICTFITHKVILRQQESLAGAYVLVSLTASRLNSKDILQDVHANKLAHKTKYMENLASPKQRRDFQTCLLIYNSLQGLHKVWLVVSLLQNMNPFFTYRVLKTAEYYFFLKTKHLNYYVPLSIADQTQNIFQISSVCLNV